MIARRHLALAAVVAVAVLVYVPALHGPFTYDDRIEVVGNRALRDIAAWDSIFRYNPSRALLIASYAVNWAVGGLDPFGYHLTSVAIHAVNVALAWRLCRRTLGPEHGALAAALWAAHPMASEAVAYIAGRSDALVATWWLAAANAWIDGRLLAAFAAWAAGLATKETAVAMPLLAWALEPWRAKAPDDGARLRTVGIAAATLPMLAVVTRLLVGGWPAPEVARSLAEQAVGQAGSWGLAAKLWAFPVGQSVLHDLGARVDAGSVAGFGVAVVVVLAARRPGPGRLAAVLWAAPLIPVAMFPAREVFAEHRAYLSGLGATVALAARMPDRARRAALLLVVPLALATWARAGVWADEIGLWTDAARKNPSSRDAAYGEGDARRLAGDWTGADDAYRRAIALRPGDVDARLNLGIVLAQRGRDDEARATWGDVLRDAPRTCAAHNNLGALSLRRGDVEAAVRSWTSTLRWCPDDPLAHLALGNLAADRGELPRAVFHLRKFVELAPWGHPAEREARERLARLTRG